ncbi:MAG: DUF1569 domain-containing protein [Planctomycetota bacterium]
MPPTESPTQAAIDTTKVKGRRKLHFAALDDAVAEAGRLAEAESAGRLAARGNWTLGQAVAHIAYWAERPYVGYPPEASPPWWMRMVMRVVRGLLFRYGMSPGVRLPGVPAGTLGADDMPAGEAVDRLRDAFAQLDADCPADPNPLFGPMTHDQWRTLNQRHAELHFSFFEATAEGG